MLGEAAVWRPDKPTPTADEVMADSRYAMYLTGWPRKGDHGLVAEDHGPVGAAWYRTFTEASHGYGFVGEDVPELSIAVIASRRHEGIGRRLLVDLINASDSQGYPALSLSVAEANPARRLYESVGFVSVEKHGSSWTMVRYADRSQCPSTGVQGQRRALLRVPELVDRRYPRGSDELPGPVAFSIVTVDLADTRVPALGIIATMVPLGDGPLGTFTTFVAMPNPDSSAAAVGVLMPTTFGSVTMTEGHGMNWTVLCPLVVLWMVHAGPQGTEAGDWPLSLIHI